MKTLSLRRESNRKQLILDLFKKIDYLTNNPPSDPLEECAQIEEYICKITEIEKDISVQLPQREDKWNNFTRWCNQHGILMDKFCIKKVDDGEYGLVCNSQFDQNDVVLQIPRKLFLSTDTALADPKLSPFVDDVVFTQMPNLVLTIHLMAEYNKPNSFWASYLQTLPSSYQTVLYLNVQELTQLRGSPLLEEVVKIKRNIARQYAYLSMKLETWKSSKNHSPIGPFTYEFFRWASSTVMTRQNSVPSQSDHAKYTLALIPLWDMCNHRNGNICTDFDIDNNSLVFYSMDDLKSGDEIFNYYGNRKNADFFLHNGFVYEEHNDDSVRIKIGLSPADPLYSLKEALCKKINLPTNDVFELSHKSSALNKHLLAIVRVFLLNKDQLQKWIACEKPSRLFECEELVELHDKVMQFLSMRCTLLLRKYANVETFLNGNIEKMINCEKRILQSYVAI